MKKTLLNNEHILYFRPTTILCIYLFTDSRNIQWTPTVCSEPSCALGIQIRKQKV